MHLFNYKICKKPFSYIAKFYNYNDNKITSYSYILLYRYYILNNDAMVFYFTINILKSITSLLILSYEVALENIM